VPPASPVTDQVNSSDVASKNILIDIPDLKNVSIDSSSIVPDGYEFTAKGSSYRRNIFGGLFNSSRYRHSTVIKKSGRSV